MISSSNGKGYVPQLAVPRVDREYEWAPGLPIEVEVVDEVAEDLGVLTHVWSRVGSPVCERIEPLTVQEVVLEVRRFKRAGAELSTHPSRIWPRPGAPRRVAADLVAGSGRSARPS